MSAVFKLRPDDAAEHRLGGVLAYVSDDDSEAVLRRVAQRLALPHFHIRRGDARTAERDLKVERSPAVLIVDVSTIDTVLDAMHRLSDVCEPQLHVIVIGHANDVGLYRQLLTLGAADYLFKPLHSDLVETILTRLDAGETRVGEARRGKLVVVTGARGGVGASSLAANLASYLADKASRRVALVDLDLSTGAQALLLNATPNPGLADALEAPHRIDDLFIERATIAINPRLSLLASELPPERTIAPTPAGLDALLKRLRRGHHYVILDAARGSAALLDATLDTASLDIHVTEATLLSARDTARRLDRAGPGYRVLVVHNKAGRPGDLAEADLNGALRRAPDLTVPFQPRAFGEGVNFGKPAWAGDARVETAVCRLARELSGLPGEADAPRSLFARLFGQRR